MHDRTTVRLARRAHRLLGWALVAGVAGQMAMATFGIFVLLGARGYLVHGTVGRLVALLPLLLLATALAGRLGRREVVAALGLVGLAALQVGLVLLAREGIGVAMALHPVNGGAMLALAGYVAGRLHPVEVAPGPARQPGAVSGAAAAAV